MDRFLSLASFMIVSLNMALDHGSHERPIAYDRLLPIHCLYETVHALVGSAYSNEEQNNNSNNRPRETRQQRFQPLIWLLNISAVSAFCASLFQDGHVWHKLLLANAMLCWPLKDTTNRPAPSPSPAMTSNLILTLLEHAIVFAMTDYSKPNDPQCRKWLAITSAPVALLSYLLSRTWAEGQQDAEIEFLASLMHVPSLVALWLFGLSPMANRHFALHDNDPHSATFQVLTARRPLPWSGTLAHCKAVYCSTNTDRRIGRGPA